MVSSAEFLRSFYSNGGESSFRDLMESSKRKAASNEAAGKRFKADASVAPSTFERHLAELDSTDVEEFESELSVLSQEDKWPRPPAELDVQVKQTSLSHSYRCFVSSTGLLFRPTV